MYTYIFIDKGKLFEYNSFLLNKADGNHFQNGFPSGFYTPFQALLNVNRSQVSIALLYEIVLLRASCFWFVEISLNEMVKI